MARIKTVNTKSYYGTALVLVVTDDETGEVIAAYLKSYKTIVCSVIMNGDLIIRHWGDYSVTSMKHINDFLDWFGFPRLNKKQWENT